MTHRAFLMGLVWVATASGVAGQEGEKPAAERKSVDADLAQKGYALIVTYCGKCHGKGASEGGGSLDVTEPASLIDNGYIDADSPEESYLWQRIINGEMPPEGEPTPTAHEGEVLRRWMAAKAPKPERARREFKSVLAVHRDIRADLAAARIIDRPYLIYFTLAHLYNHPDVSDFDLRLYRAALSKAINSLSSRPDIVVPKAVDPEGTILRVDLRRLGWDQADWSAILAAHPYGLTYGDVQDRALLEVAQEIAQLAGNRRGGDLTAIRADWFIVNATRPPLYHRLLEIPQTAAELERKLGVDPDRNFLDDLVHRAGFAESGVSTANRLVERHDANVFQDAYYWKSYDFREDRVKSNLFQKPLGPAFRNNPFADFAFEHDGGELIFSLANGLQGYMLVDGKGGRIDGGPIEVVQDSKRTSGSPVVVNGISCMHCHARGMITFRDTVRDGVALFGDARKKVIALYPPREAMDKILADDSKVFLDALKKAMGPFLLVEGDASKSIEQFPEPIGEVARAYYRNVGLLEAACELGFDDPEKLKTAIHNNGELRKLGLAPLAAGRTIDRAFWESKQNVVSPMQEAARMLDFGTPYVSLNLDGP